MTQNIKSWKERRAAGCSTERAMLDEIADLRAQLAAKGQGEMREALQYAVDMHTPGRTDGPTHHHVQVFLHKANAALSAPASAQPADPFDAEFLAKRLARVAKLTGAHIPEHFTHAQIAETAGTILGEIARKLEAGAQLGQQESAAEARISPLRPAIRAIQAIECPYNEKDHGTNWHASAHAWDMAMIEAIRAVNKLVDAASPAAQPVAKDEQWSKQPPSEQGEYWHWNGDDDTAPYIYHILWSGTAKKCFVSIGQYGIEEASFCDEFGGWWKKIPQPAIPQDSANNGADEQKGGAHE